MTHFLLEGSYVLIQDYLHIYIYILYIYIDLPLSLFLFEHLGAVASFVQTTPIGRAPFADRPQQDLPAELPSEVTFAAAVSACTEVFRIT